MSSRRSVTRVAASGIASYVGDELTVEAPLVLVVGGQAIATLMRTPGHDLELAAGWLVVESGVTSPNELVGLRQCRTDDDLELRSAGEMSGRGVDQVHLSLGPDVTPPMPRAWVTGSSCGVCSADVLDLAILRRTAPHSPDFAVNASILTGMPDGLRARQRTFDRTGSLHAAGLFTTFGSCIAVREDVGRHNAVDKVVGWAMLEGRLPLTDLLLCVSGRVSFEIVQKAVAGGVAGIVAVSAPSDLAVDLAREYDLLLAGMVRNGSLNLYAGSEYVR